MMDGKLNTIYLLTLWVPSFSGEHEAINTLAQALHGRGYQVAVFSRAAVDRSNHYARRLAANGIPLIAPPAWLGPLGNDWHTWRIRDGLVRLLVALAAPVLVLPALIDAAIRRRPLGRSWLGAVGRCRGWLARAVHWDYLTFLLHRALDTRARRFPPDVVHVHGYRSGFAQGIEWACSRGFPTVYTHHGTPVPGFAHPQGFHVCINKATLLIAVSEAARAALQKMGRPRHEVTVVPHIIGGPQKLSRNTMKPLTSKEATTITCVAKLSPEKGIEYLLLAVPYILRRCRTPRFLLAGDGPLRTLLAKQSKDLGIADRVLFCGSFDHDRLPEIMGMTDIFVLPSLTEGLPVSVIEAMAYGKPIVATRVGGIPELITDGVTGLLVPAKDPQALAAALVRLLRDENLRARLGTAARRAYEDGPFTPEAGANATIAVYERAMALGCVEISS